MFYIGLLLKMTLFHQPISKFLPFPKGLALKEICWSLLYYIHVISIFRIAPLFFCVLIHNKYSFLVVVVFFSSENNFCLLQQPCILENILFLVFYCMFGKMIISLPLPVNTKIIFCCQRKKKVFLLSEMNYWTLTKNILLIRIHCIWYPLINSIFHYLLWISIWLKLWSNFIVWISWRFLRTTSNFCLFFVWIFCLFLFLTYFCFSYNTAHVLVR